MRRTTTLAAVVAATAAFAAPSLAASQPALKADKSTGLSSGEKVTITGTGFAPNTQLFVAVCDAGKAPGTACDTGNYAQATTGAKGDLSVSMKLVATFGSTDCLTAKCAIVTNDPAHPSDTRNVSTLPITFAGAGAGATAPASTAPTAPADTPADTATAKKSDGGSNTALYVGGAVVIVVVGAGVVYLLRRRSAQA